MENLLTQVEQLHDQENSSGAGKLKPTIEEMQGMESFVDKGVVYLKGDCEAIFIGDTHGDSDAIRAILNQTGFIERISRGEKIKLVFLGDYADRGKEQIINFEQILDLKLNFPENVVLLRGNHEEFEIADRDGFHDSLEEKFGLKNGNKIFDRYNDLFQKLHTAVVTENGVIALHGGIGRFTSLKDLQEDKNRENIRWSDPNSNISGLKDNSRGAGLEFGRDVLENFLRNTGSKVLIRSHHLWQIGIWWDGKLATIFSTGSTSPKSGYRSIKDATFTVIDLRKSINGITEEYIRKIDYSLANQ